jgi:hypothetical protein
MSNCKYSSTQSILGVSDTGQPGTFRRVKIDPATEPIIAKILKKHKSELQENSVDFPLSYDPAVKTGTGALSKAVNAISGFGIAKTEAPKAVQFGEIQILYKKLHTQNMLTLKNNHNRFINGFRDVHVSDKFIEIITKLLKSEDISKLFYKLHEQEKVILNELLYLSKLYRNYKEDDDIIKTDHIKTALKDRFKLLEGELLAGNDSQNVKKELFHLAHKMQNYNMISLPELRNYIKQLK